MDEIERMLRWQIQQRGVSDARVLDAMREVKREWFVPPEMRGEAYTDRALPVEEGQTISQPYIVALMTAELEIVPTSSILEIGTGTGWQTAILARLGRQVYTVERHGRLLEGARHRLGRLGTTNVQYRLGDGTRGWPEKAPFSRIIITAAGPAIPRKLLLGQLADDGLAVVPAGPDAWQDLIKIRRKGDELIESTLCPCRFVRLVGQEGWQAE